MTPPARPPDRAATAERWARIDELFHAAIDRPAHERHAFLLSACGEDGRLLEEVESLLRADGSSAQPSLDAWVQAAAAARIDDGEQEARRQSGSLVGRSVLQCDIHAQIGAGGMGDVYQATDRTLGRHVAIKTLPRAVPGDERRLERFRREARAASALSHPNVAAIYQFGEAAGQPFIAMEYVEGRTLDAMLLSDGPMPLRRAVDVALQVSAALGEAHDAGITHRDIKPGNVMVSSRGVVKVLDFGLAKLVSEAAEVVGAAAVASAPREPPPGTSDIAPAFSPDGARIAFQRIPTTAVSDIWVADASGANERRITFDSAMVTGPVWAQDGRSLIFGSARLGAGRLWRVAASGGVPQPLPDTGPGATMPTVPKRGDRMAFVATFQDTNVWELRVGADGAAIGPPRPIPSGSSWLDGSPDFSRDGRLLVFASNRTGRDEIFLSEVDSLTARQLTDFSGMAGSTVGSPRVSPDGTQVVFDARVLGNADIYVVDVAGGSPRRLTTDPGADVVPVWSPDGAWVYFTSRRTGRPEIWRIPSAGGIEEQLTDGGAFGAQFSSDGRYLIYGRERAGTSLWRRPVEGGAEEPALLDEREPRVVVQS